MAKTPPTGLQRLINTDDWKWTPFGQWVRFLFPRLIASTFIWAWFPNAVGVILLILLFTALRVPGDFKP